jgi:hypothetical protein
VLHGASRSGNVPVFPVLRRAFIVAAPLSNQ